MSDRPLSLAPIPRSICLAGCDGAGKTTQAERLVRFLAAKGVATRVCTVWDLLDNAAPGGIPFISKREIDGFLGGLHSEARAMFLHMAMREALDRALDERGDGVLLVVGYWLKYNASERAYGVSEALLDALASAFPPMSLALFLDLDPTFALARKQALSGYESGGTGASGFLAFQARLHLEMLRLREASKAPWQIIDAQGSPAEVESRLVERMTPWLITEGLL
jgi:dTMP kinase